MCVKWENSNYINRYQYSNSITRSREGKIRENLCTFVCMYVCNESARYWENWVLVL